MLIQVLYNVSGDNVILIHGNSGGDEGECEMPSGLNMKVRQRPKAHRIERVRKLDLCVCVCVSHAAVAEMVVIPFICSTEFQFLRYY